MLYLSVFMNTVSFPSKLAYVLTNSVDENSNFTTIIDSGKYAEYSPQYNSNIIQISYSTCGEISERFSIS